jgi:phosphocarrier protein NPr
LAEHCEKQLLIRNKLGLHARAASKLVMLANRFQATVTIEHNGRQTDAASVMGLLLLETCQGQSIRVITHGKDAEAAMAAVEKLIEARFDEAE